ncbi:MAG TPA: Ger(x)C family spore germination protein [Clostridiales bacterium]|nr:Ger(x)C family spore germination protein [Clostridiales bacterium]
MSLKMKKLLAILSIVPIIFLSGCWSSREINTMAIVIGIGIDKTESGYLVTVQVLNQKAIASKKPVDEPSVILYSEEGKNLEEIMRRFTTKTSSILYNAHLRIVVIGEDVAKDGIKDILDFFARGHEFRTDFFFVITKDTTANRVLSILTPFEGVPGMKMFDSLKNSEDTWASTKSIRIVELVNDILADGKNPVITGVEVTDEITDNKMATTSIDALKQTQVTNRTKYFGLGAFKKDKLVGWLDEDESKGYNYIIGNVKETVGYAEYGQKVKITYEVISAKSEIKADLVNGKPTMNVKIDIIANIGTVDGEFDVSKKENEKILSDIAEKKVKLICKKVLNKTQKDLKTDIFEFGEVIHREYPKVWEKIKDDWNNEFVNIPVKITVDVKINQLGQITKPFFIKEKE